MDGETILNFVRNYGMIAVFVMIMLEYACFPMPSEIVLPLAGAYAAYYGQSFLLVLLISVIAGVCGSLICYLIGFYGGTPLLDRMARRYSKIVPGIEASQQWFDQHGSKSVVIARVLPFCRTYISFVAGLSRQKLYKFLPLSALGIFVWNLVLVGLGFKLAGNLGAVTTFVTRYTYILIPFVFLIVFLIIRRIIKNMKVEKAK